MQLLLVYAITLVIGEAAVVGLGEIVEMFYPSASLIAFMGMFLAMLWIAWFVALRVDRRFFEPVKPS